MKGTITISGVEPNQYSIKMEIDAISRFEKHAVIDGLVQAFDLSKEERIMIAYCIMRGGLRSILGVDPATMKIDLDTIEKAKERLDRNETDRQNNPQK